MTADPDNAKRAEVLKLAGSIMAENADISLCYALQRAKAELQVGLVLERLREQRNRGSTG
jgi:hypothetical protein